MLPSPALAGALVERAIEHRYVDWSVARPVIRFPEPDQPGPDACSAGPDDAPVESSLGPTAKISSSVLAQRVTARHRRTHRWALQQLVWNISHLPRVTACRRRRIGGDDPALRVRDGAAHFTGVQTCGSVWACPMCGEQIRFKRAEEIEIGLRTLYETPLNWGEMREHGDSGRARCCPVDGRSQATRGTALLLTLTTPHGAGDDLKALLRLNSRGYGRITGGQGWLEDKETFRIVGTIRADDATHGPHGWHPHLHILVLVAAELTSAQCTRLRRRLYVRWARYFTGRRARAGKRGKPGYAPWRGTVPSYRHSVHLEPVRRAAHAARYTAAVGGMVATTAPARPRMITSEDRSISNELGHHDDAAGRTSTDDGSRTPWEILRDIQAAPMCSADGEVNEARERNVALWREWEESTHGRQAVRWSRGLKPVLGVPGRGADATRSAAWPATTVHHFDSVEWWAVCGTRGAPARVLDYAEMGGEAAVREYLARIVPRWIQRHARDDAWTRRHRALMHRMPRRMIARVA